MIICSNATGWEENEDIDKGDEATNSLDILVKSTFDNSLDVKKEENYKFSQK